MNERDRCPYHDDLVKEVECIKETLIKLNDTCTNLNETTIKSREFYEQMLIHNQKESDRIITGSKVYILLMVLIGVICALLGYSFHGV